MEEKLKLWEKISKGEVIFPEDVLMCIDEKKFLDDFKDGELRTFVLSIDAGLKCRMNHLVEQVKKLSKDCVPFHFYACFFFPTHSPLLISELVDFAIVSNLSILITKIRRGCGIRFLFPSMHSIRLF